MKKSLISALLGCTMLAGCNNADDKVDANTRSTFDALSKANVEATARIDALTTQVGALKEGNQAALSGLIAEIGDIKDTNAKAAKAIDDLSIRIGELQGSGATVTDALSGQVGDLKTANDKMATSIAELFSQVGELQVTGKISGTKIAELGEKILGIEGKQKEAATTAAELDAAIRALQTGATVTTGAVTSLDRITKALKLESAQPRITALKSELANTLPAVTDLVRLGANAKTVRARAEKADISALSAGDKSALADVLKQLGTVEGDISAKQAELAATIGKGDGLIKGIQTLPADATSAQVAALDDEITALTTSLKDGKPAFQAGTADLDKRTKANRGEINNLTGLFLAEYVNTMRDAQSSGDFTRGNTFPATAMPFGFNFWTPTNRDDKNWFYQFKTSENGSLIDTVQAFAVVHEPSPWIGNRQSLNIMPVSKVNSSGEPETNRSARAEKFQRKNEIASAHYYSLEFDSGIKTEITPTDHAAYFRFTAPAGRDTLAVVVSGFSGDTQNRGRDRPSQRGNLGQ